MSSQSPILLPHEPARKFEQKPTFHPMDASVSSSPPVPQVLSAPPHAFARVERSLSAAFTIFTCAVPSGQLPGAPRPFTTLRSHVCTAELRTRTYAAEPLMM